MREDCEVSFSKGIEGRHHQPKDKDLEIQAALAKRVEQLEDAGKDEAREKSLTYVDLLGGFVFVRRTAGDFHFFSLP